MSRGRDPGASGQDIKPNPDTRPGLKPKEKNQKQKGIRKEKARSRTHEMRTTSPCPDQEYFKSDRAMDRKSSASSCTRREQGQRDLGVT